MSRRCHQPRVYAFEPNPALCEIATGNAALYEIYAGVFGCGLARAAGEAEFTFFQGFSLLSGFHTDAETEKSIVKAYLRNQQIQGSALLNELVSYAEELLNGKFDARKFTVPLRTLSDVITAEHVQQMDLLKINAEKSELGALAGIGEGDWEKIRQVVLEVDVPENLDAILHLLSEQGFSVVVEQDPLLEGTPLSYVYARRAAPDEWATGDRRQAAGPELEALALACRPSPARASG